MNKPIIGIVLDSEKQGDYSNYPYYVLREHYFSAVSKAGGIPIALPHSTDNIEEYLNVIDGLLLPGGDFDIPPEMYGSQKTHESVTLKQDRTNFEYTLTKKALDMDMPILGICAGEQLLAVILGGTLIQDIKSEVSNGLEHYQELRTEPAHKINIKEGTKLHAIIADTVLNVNSHHHQAVKEVSDKFIVSATSDDGVIEAIEVINKKFCIGLEWHPEFMINSKELDIFKAFVEACKN